MSTFAYRLLDFLTRFPPPATLPAEVEAYHPYQQPDTRHLLTQFVQRFYADNQPRVAVLGINPGRFGGGRTGVAFTDPAALADACGIANDLPRHAELSSQFVYRVVAELGGPGAFYQHFYLGSLYPLVLLRKALNYNYYDDPCLIASLWPDLQLSLRQQVLEVGMARHAAVCLGRRNGQFLQRLNDELGLFDELHILDHPRYLMQYKRRELTEHVQRYVEVLGSCVAG